MGNHIDSNKVISKSNVTATITIPMELSDKIEKRMEGTDFNSVSSYVTYILRQIISNLENQSEKDNGFSEEDEKKIEEKLRHMGYVN